MYTFAFFFDLVLYLPTKTRAKNSFKPDVFGHTLYSENVFKKFWKIFLSHDMRAIGQWAKLSWLILFIF